MSYRFAKIGVVLFVFSIPALLILWPIGTELFRSGAISYLTRDIITHSPIIAMTMAGLTLYTLGRKSFWEKAEWGKDKAIHHPFLGVVLFTLGGYMSFWNKEGFEDMVGTPLRSSLPLNPGEPLASFLPMVWSSLWVIMGVLLIVDQLPLHPKGVAGAMVAVISFQVFWDVSSPVSYFLGYAVYQVVSIVLLLLTLMGIIIFAVSFRKKTRVSN